ncbi:MAG: hypothetical protein L0191_21675, partial [Acidobacteria bacterium]|nr:hypothetical protein [Acidobacteriota bacterium]
IGGHATVEGKVEGSVVVIGGELDFSGEAEEVVTILSKANFQSGTAVHGNMVHILGEMTKAPDARFEGEKVDVGSALPPRMQRILSRGLIGLFVLLRLIGLIVSGVVVMLIALLIPERIERMSEELDTRWPASIGFGLLACVIVVILCVGLAITIIGIPFAILVGMLAKLLGLVGITAMLMLVGKKLGTETGLLGEHSSLLASVMLGFAVLALVRFIPLFGELVWTVLGIIGLGLTVVTRLGRDTAEAGAS